MAETKHSCPPPEFLILINVSGGMWWLAAVSYEINRENSHG
jgi:hypothetical protein